MKIGTTTHPKFRRLQKRLKLPTYAVAGLLELIWMLTSQYAPEDGNIGRFSHQEIADYCDYEGDADSLVEALIEARWLDRDADSLRVHDWIDHRPAYIQDRLRIRESRKKPGNFNSSSEDVPNSSEQFANTREESAPAKPSQAKPSPTMSSLAKPSLASSDGMLAGSLAADDFISLSVDEANDVVRDANKLSKACSRLDRDFVWRCCWVGYCVDRGFTSDLIKRLQANSIQKPQRYIEKALGDELEAKGLSLVDCLTKVPAPPPLKEKAS